MLGGGGLEVGVMCMDLSAAILDGATLWWKARLTFKVGLPVWASKSLHN